MYKEIENISEDRLLRDVNVGGFRLVLWDTYKIDRYGIPQLGYLFFDKNGSVLFSGENYYCSPMHSIDSDDSVRGILCFLTLRPGDTDAEYFEEYTKEQMDFAETDAEYLQEYGCHSGDYGDEYEAPELIDWEK